MGVRGKGGWHPLANNGALPFGDAPENRQAIVFCGLPKGFPAVIPEPTFGFSREKKFSPSPGSTVPYLEKTGM